MKELFKDDFVFWEVRTRKSPYELKVGGFSNGKGADVSLAIV